MQITIENFIRHYCVRKKDQVLNPPQHALRDFVFPRNSQLHFIHKDGTEVGIMATNPLLLNHSKGKVVSEFVPEYTVEDSSTFKRVSMDKKEPIRDYMRRNKGILNAKTAKSDMLADKNLVVTNYGLMEENVNYYTNKREWWFRFQNYWGSIFQSISQRVLTNRRNHFIVIDVPEVMPSVSQFRKFEVSDADQNIDKIANSERMLIAQFWLWFAGSNRSLIPRDPNVLNRLFFVLKWHDKWICFQLPTIAQNMKSATNLRGSWDQVRMQKNFIVMLLTLPFGAVDNIAYEDDEDEASDAPLDQEEVASIRQDMTDDTLLLSEDSNDPKDMVKAKLAQAFDNMDIAIAAENDVDHLDKKRNKKADSLLDQLEEVNVNVADSVESASPDNEQTILKDDAGTPINSISREDLLIDYKEYQPKELNLEEKFNEHLNDYIVKGNVTPQQKTRLEKIARRYKEIPDPKTGVGSLEVAARIDPKKLLISKEEKFVEKINMVNDQSMLKSTLLTFDRRYINDIMHKDVYNAVLSFQRRGIAVQNYQVKRVTQLGDDYEVHSVKLVPIEGEPSTVTFKIPIVDDYGVFQSRGVKNRMAKQRVDVPIRKIGPDEVALTSYMSKMFVERCQFVAYSREKWLKGQLLELGGTNNGVKVSFGNVFRNTEDTPLIYSQFARSIKRLRFNDYDLNFDCNKLDEFFGKEVVKAFGATRPTQILLGKGANTLLVLSKAGIVHECSIDQKKNVELGRLEDFIGLDSTKAPMDCADLNVVSKNIPIGVVLAYYMGLGNLLKTLKVEHRFIEKNTRGTVFNDDAIVIEFADGRLVIEKYDYKAQLVLAGFNRYHKHIKPFNMVEFDKKSVYGNVFAGAGLPARYLREFNILRDMWIDPITEEELKSMGEPTDFVMLLMRSVELLEKDMHPAAMERAYQRDRGYERISGMVYGEMIKSIRAYDSTPVRAKAKVSMNPEAVWMKIIGDETTAPIEESNPIHSLKDVERVVYRGEGGRSSRTMNSQSRMFSPTAIGVDSEATVDNGDAGTIRFLTANPNYRSLRGTINVLDTFDESVNSTCLNTSTLLAPAADTDDPKRRNFISIQNSRTTNSEGSHLCPTRTGYEYVLPWRTSDLYATIAREEGIVTRVTEHAIVVKYKSGKEATVELGKRDGKWAGKIIPHNVITEFKEGQKVKEGDAIAYNPMFFTTDKLGGNLAFKTGVLARIGLIEDEFTNEDSSEIYSVFADKLTTKNCEVRTIEVAFDKDVFELVKVGEKVDYDSLLCVLRNNIEGVVDQYSSTSLEALKDVNSTSPRAKYNGVVTDVSAVYVGDVEEMSPTLQAIVGNTDRKLYKKAKDLNKERVTGQMKVGSRQDGKILNPKTVLIMITIDISQEMGIGSKVVYGHQMKSVVSNVFNEEFTTQDGVPYWGKFSYTSYIKRIVESTLKAGICNSFSVAISEAACEIYEKE